jgi:hypothetical protein
MLEQDSQEHATKRPGNATWQSSLVACMVFVSLRLHFTSDLFLCMGLRRHFEYLLGLVRLGKMAMAKSLVMTT